MASHFLKSTLAAALLSAIAVPAFAVDLQFYFPVSVGGKAADTIQSLTEDYVKSHKDVTIDAIYAGSYTDALTKAMTAARGGNAPQLSVLLSTDMFTLIDQDLIQPFDDFVSADEGKAWFGSFYPAFMLNSQTGGKTWGIPFQRSTPVMYWNKEAFKEAGLDPDKAPATWEEMVEYGHKLTKKDASGNVTQWGLRIPLDGFPYWLFQGLSTPAGAILANADGNKTDFANPKVVEALTFLVKMAKEEKIMEEGVTAWSATPKAFFEREAAMIWTTTGNLTNIRTNAPFDFGVGFLPKHERYGAPTGGGNFVLFKDATEEQKKAAVQFVKWMTEPEQAAKWSIATGYVAPSPAAWETEAMKAYAKDVPQAAVARDQLEYAVAELSTYENQKVTNFLNDAIHAALAGEKTPEEALKEAQEKAERVLKNYR
ncbi:ABC transporter substrate-binding protein [Cohaesibacter haloalkalitolerans]|uniref:ABC transporter substrate-binding protein n=1 Tax=Cohaesibacter haloalkalitolerans TaxID=1162980 RepID=UPI000E65CC6E|nr:ABC transporter substrate-binding protein [Cohaesibacter haloalkalitolerans]